MSTTVLDRPAAPVGEPAVDCETPLVRTRLSEAIREGARHHRQVDGYVYYRQGKRTCALGALAVGLLGPQAFEAIATHTWTDKLETLVHEQTGVWLRQPVSILDDDPAVRPLFKGLAPHKRTLEQAIVYLNDAAGWSREAIADHLEALGL